MCALLCMCPSACLCLARRKEIRWRMCSQFNLHLSGLLLLAARNISTVWVRSFSNVKLPSEGNGLLGLLGWNSPHIEIFAHWIHKRMVWSFITFRGSALQGNETLAIVANTFAVRSKSSAWSTIGKQWPGRTFSANADVLLSEVVCKDVLEFNL